MEKKDTKLFQASTILFVLNVTASALNYLCQLVLARVLSVESYGTVNTIFSFMMIVAVPGTTLTMVVAKYYASSYDEKSKRQYLMKQLKAVMILTVVVFFILCIGKNNFGKILSIDDTFVLMMAFILAALGFFQPLYSGVFSGNKRFILVGIYSMFIPLYKLIAVGGAYISSQNDNYRLYMVLLIMLGGVIVTALFGQYESQKIVKKCGMELCKERLYSFEDLNTLILNISLMLYMNIDLLSVRYIGNDTESGLYSSALLFGRIIYYFATTLGTILLPSVADPSVDEEGRRKTLNRALSLVIIFALICILPINIFKDFLIRVLYGTDYLLAAKYVIYVSIISISLSVCTILVNYVVGIARAKNATRIMCVMDVLLIIAVFVANSVKNSLIAICTIGIIGAVTIYIVEYREET
ncbi:MAG TPA: oligosaccharide flippase family protein [[Clostridium] spiroforme]|mgnify:CR=1 FL=1|uniref:Oligosaccharide flippase family protein n=1 Tax=Thomasclavelia spiroformis TaxID=29348 RepID=A0A921KI74_9FIRM|nr:oligosaccharide flippase family protein [Thomasclavelia spiroformis]